MEILVNFHKINVSKYKYMLPSRLRKRSVSSPATNLYGQPMERLYSYSILELLSLETFPGPLTSTLLVGKARKQVGILLYFQCTHTAVHANSILVG